MDSRFKEWVYIEGLMQSAYTEFCRCRESDQTLKHRGK